MLKAYVYLLVCHVLFPAQGAGFLLRLAVYKFLARSTFVQGSLVLNILYTAVRILYPAGNQMIYQQINFSELPRFVHSGQNSFFEISKKKMPFFLAIL